MFMIILSIDWWVGTHFRWTEDYKSRAFLWIARLKYFCNSDSVAIADGVLVQRGRFLLRTIALRIPMFEYRNPKLVLTDFDPPKIMVNI